MYDFHYHYNYIKKTYKNKTTVLFTETDSLTYHSSAQNVCEDMKLHASLFDFSDYPKNHQLYCEDNKKIIRKFKDELNGKLVFEFERFKSKMHSLKSLKSAKKREKGVST